MEDKHLKLINEILNLATPCLASVELNFNTILSGKGQSWKVEYTYTDIYGTKKITKSDEFLEGQDVDNLEAVLVCLLEELKTKNNN